MKEPSGRETCKRLLNVSRETMLGFDVYLQLLSEWQKKLNLVGFSTLIDPWERHILDCGQLANFIKKKNEKVFDIGSGAGLPGIVLGIMGYKNMVLVESDFKKTVFIIEALRKCNVQAFVENKRVESLDTMLGHTIVSRAFAPIDKTLFLLRGAISQKTKIFFLKGRRANKEINNAKVFWKNNQNIFNYDLKIRFESYNSLSSIDSSIIKCTFREKIDG
tara:strand:+ start:2988 stop:3644 length:657 start_codon:yes stop_codon:yes gene_type:complete